MIAKLLKKIVVMAVAVIILLFLVSTGIKEKPVWMLDYNGLLDYPEERGKVEIKGQLIEDKPLYTMEKISYTSGNARISGLLFLPKKQNVSGMVMLPGANGKKENHLKLGKELASEGYAFLTIDQRGIGETGGAVNTMEQDFKLYVENEEPVQHKMVLDALRAFDVLREQQNVDEDSIVMAGESMGGRFAAIATALDERIKGLIAISTSGYGKHELATAQQKFMGSINPDIYIPKISPRRIAMLHSENDSVVPFENAMESFGIAKEPKRMIVMEEPCDHGYCADEKEKFIEAFEWVLG